VPCDSSAFGDAAPAADTPPFEGERAIQRANLDADAADLLTLWPSLSPQVRAALLGMARAAAR
jgi:hypothetical protein